MGVARLDTTRLDVRSGWPRSATPMGMLTGSVFDDLEPILFVPSEEVPDRRSFHLETVGQLRRISPSEKSENPKSSNSALLR